jgi:hypothetical protein
MTLRKLEEIESRPRNRYSVLIFLGTWLYLFFSTRKVSIFADDAGFIKTFTLTGLQGTLDSLKGYVPGRNLHILWQNIYFHVTSYSLDEFWKYRILQTAMFTLNGFLVNLIVYKLTRRPKLGVFAGLAVILCPVYMEVVWWASALPMHLTSTLFVLLVIQASHSRFRKITAFLLINLFGVLALLTYDQAAAAVLTFFIFEIYRYMTTENGDVKKKFLYVSAQLSIFAAALAFYLAMILSRDGNGPGISSESFQRLTQNLIFLPLHVVADNWIIAAIATTCLFSVSFTFFKKELFSVDLHKRIILSVSNKFIFLSLASYFPIAIWYVSPRHLYLPFIFFVIWINLAISKLMNGTKYHPKLSFIPIVVLTFFVVTANNELLQKTEHSIYRTKVYEQISKDAITNPIGKFCILLEPKLANVFLFQHEDINAALNFFSSNQNYIGSECRGVSLLMNHQQPVLQREFEKSGLTYLWYVENLRSTIERPSYSYNGQVGSMR